MVFLNIVHTTFRPLRQLTKLPTINAKLDATRTYVRWASRRPVAIVNEDELYEASDTTRETFAESKKFSSRKSRGRNSTEKTAKTAKTAKTTKATNDVESLATEKKKAFTVLQDNDKIIRSLMIKVKSRKKREKNDNIALEGQRLIQDALRAGVQPKVVLFSNSADIDKLNLPPKTQLYKVPYKTIQLWSTVSSSPGLIGIFETPNIENTAPADDALPLTIICDNVREPGNLGSIMRAAAGVGCEKLILIKGCVDLWDPKVLRSACGAHFRLPIHAFPVWDDVPALISEDSNIIVTDSNFKDEFVSKYDTDMLQPSLGVFDADPESLKSYCINEDSGTETIESEPTSSFKKKMADLLLQLPIVPYYTLDYTKKETVLVLSGETEGLTFDSLNLLKERKGIRINIPLVNGVDSLNAGVAFGIVTFEIKRQFIKKQSTL
ncbi:PREDICTED: rRNA methyltransferase 3, mitochondrial [Dufourea novaeangliae]|uniref:RNA methyltransferase-like protein 1 n=1 Tax=Dufourea novaeangliae TaxID=178035 RepID=A0A154P1J1_DUFNO|nr:PREDICTED: rRNA methyltransferase 3, mitochondrial [Dufourea novaeangliae]KZC05692.1 RNA methyltransferase-like protein 1 [Dufourea novaeangliae]